MAWPFLVTLVAVTPCEPWLVEQVERARVRTAAEPLELDCPSPQEVKVRVAGRDGPGPVSLSGFTSADPWVGAALVALVELRRAELEAGPPRGPLRPAAETEAEVSRPAEQPSVPGPRLALRPHLLFLGEALQIGFGGEVVIGAGPLNFGVGVSRHRTEGALGTLSAIDLLVVATLPFTLLEWSAARIYVEPGVGLGPCRLEGTALSDAIARSAWRGTLRTWLDLGFAVGPRPSGLNVVTGIRAGFRVAPSGQVDGQAVLAGNGPLLGAYLGIGWGP